MKRYTFKFMDHEHKFDDRLDIFMDDHEIKDSDIITIIRLDKNDYEIWVKE